MSDKLDVIRKLLAKAESTEFPAERDSLNAKANELIARYGIDEAMINAKRDVKETVETRTIVVEAPYAKDKATLINQIYTPMGCKVIQMGKPRNGLLTVLVYGYASDLDRAELLYTSLLIQAFRGMARVPSAAHHRTTAANRRAWFLGFSAVVGRRITEAESHAKETAEPTPGVSTAMVLRDRSLAVSDAFTAAHPKTRNVKASFSGRGFGDGAAAGERADIGQSRLGGNRYELV